MAFNHITLCVVAAMIIDVVFGCGSGSSSSSSNIPRSNSGRPFGYDINRNTEVYPTYHNQHGYAGVGLEHRPNSQTAIRGTGGVNPFEALNGQFRPQADVELERRLNSNGATLNIGAGVDANGQPRGQVGVRIPFRRRRSVNIKNILSDETISRALYDFFDLDKNGKLDIIDWATEGGLVSSYFKMISAYDLNGDEKLSVGEFLRIPLLPNLGLDFDEPIPQSEAASPIQDEDVVVPETTGEFDEKIIEA